MATTIDLDTRGDLFKLEVLDFTTQEFRRIYLSPSMCRWAEEVLPTMESAWGIELTPKEQFYDLSANFCAGDRLSFGLQFKPLIHITDGVWQLKTQDLRIFGWFSQKDCFIAVVADDATFIKKHDLYFGHVNVTTKNFRDTLDLDLPKFVPGADPHAVVSNFDYP